MSQEQRYKRDPNGIRFQMSGMNTVLPPDLISGKYPYLQNVRAYLQGRMVGRATQGTPVQTLGAAVHSLRRLNDTTPAGPVSGFALIGGAAGILYKDSTNVATGLSGNPVALIPFRPNASPRPYMYAGDSSENVTITASGFDCFGMLKVNSDGLTEKMGVKEPQDSPSVSTATTTTTGSITVLATARPWSNVSGANPSFNYGDNGNGTGPSVIATPVIGATLVLTATGTAVVSGSTVAPGDPGGVAPSNPGQFVPGGTSPILLGAWTDSSGVIVAGTGAGVVAIGAGVTLTVPTGATRLQIGVDGIGGAFLANSGSFAVTFSLTTSAVTTVVSTIGDVTTYYWGDSPHSGPVGIYIWKNAGDTAGSGPIRNISDAVGSTTNNSLIFDSPTTGSGATAMAWSILDNTGAVIGTKPVFTPQLETEGFQDFNMIVVGNLFIPGAGSYAMTVTSKDNVLWGIGNNATWPGIGTITGLTSQTETVNGKFPLLPYPTGGPTTITVVVTFPGAGVYPIELNYDYWDKTGRTLAVTCNGAVIPPLPGNVKEDVAYRYTYRSSVTGATSNPSPASPSGQVPSISNTITPEFSFDPQVDKVDYYRMDAALDNFTYVGTGPNTNPPTSFTDTLLDQDVIGNPLLQFDNFEPFPSIDLPKGGIVNVIGGVVEWVSGDLFNTRWLPGTIINIGGIAYTLFNRPSSNVNLLAIDVADGTAEVYEIAEPILAAQPLASLWGDTDNTAFVFACGDSLRPGTLYWSKGNNLDSAPDTNQQDVTSPSEPLINGVIANGIGMVFSAENGWTIYPNFTGALATVTGVEGDQFSLIRAGVTRGLYIRPCICTDGSGTFFYRSKDGIEMASGGGQQKSLTDTDLYNLFPHEGFVPSVLSIGTFGIFPPDDTLPELQKLRFATGYLYYDYADTNGAARTLIYDVAGGGWVVDVYSHTATVHALEEGPDVNGVLTGCSDGAIRPLENGGTAESSALSVVFTPSVNSGDARANKTLGDIFVRAKVVTPQTVAVAAFQDQYRTPITISPTSLATGNVLTPYILDIPSGFGEDITDVGISLQWPTGLASANQQSFIDLWQPDWTDLPESTQDRPTDWGDAGGPGAMWVKGLLLEADTFDAAKVISVQSGDDMSLHVPDQSPITFDGQQKIALSFRAPFVAHTVRIISTDGVPWRYWGAEWVAEPYAELVDDFVPPFDNLGSNDAKFIQGFLLEADTNNVAKAFTVQSGDNLSFHVPDQSPATFNGKSVQAFTFTPPFIAHSLRLLSADSTPWRKFTLKWIFEPFPESTAEWQTEMVSYGNVGWQHVREFNIAHISTADLTLTLIFDAGGVPQTLTLTVPNSGGLQAKTKITVPRNKFKMMSRRLSSTAPFRVFEKDMEMKIGMWGRQEPYRIIKGIGGQSADGADV